MEVPVVNSNRAGSGSTGRFRRVATVALVWMLLPLSVSATVEPRMAEDCDSVVGLGVPPPGFEERCELWVSNAPPSPLDDPGLIQVSPAGDRVFTVGTTGGLIALDAASGSQLWSATPEGSARGLALSPDGSRVFVVAQRPAPGSAPDSANDMSDLDVIVSAYEAATGQTEWIEHFSLPSIVESDRIQSIERPAAIVASPDGERVYVVVGTRLWDRIARSDVTREDVVVLAHDAISGRQHWWRRWGGKFIIEQPEVAQLDSSGGRLYIGGQQDRCAPCPSDYMLLSVQVVARDPSLEGHVVWDAYFDGLGGDDDLRGMDLAPDASRAYLTGVSEGTFGNDTDWATFAAATSDGSELWQSRYEGGTYPAGALSYETNQHEAAAIVASPVGDRVIVTGHASGLKLSTGVGTTISYDPSTGQEQWIADYRLTNVGADHLATRLGWSVGRHAHLDIAPDGSSVYVTGPSSTISYDASDGQILWVARHNGKTVRPAPDGEMVYVRGQNQLRAFEVDG